MNASMSSKRYLSMCRIKYLSDKIQLFGILLLLQCVELEAPRLKRETRCAVYMDAAWKFEDGRCPEGKRYHCYENRLDEIVARGCFQLKDCLKGSHPIVEGETIVCGFCPTGFYQPVDGLKSNEYTFSYCSSHSPPCKPEHGQSLCQAGTKESDRTCSCNATLGYSPGTNTSECQCFTPDSLCLACRFTGCPVGSVETKREFCEPEQKTTQVMATSTPKQTSPGQEDSSLSPGAIVAIVLVLLGVAVLAVVLYCCRKNLPCWKKQEESVGDHEGDHDAVRDVIFHNPAGGTVNVSVYKVGHLIASNGGPPSVMDANGPAETARGHRSQPPSNPDLVSETADAEARPCTPTAPPRSLGPESIRSNPSDLPDSPASLDNLKSPTANISDDTDETTPLVEKNQREEETAVSDGSVLDRGESEETSLKAHCTDQDITETKRIAQSEDRKNTSQNNGLNARLYDAEEPKLLSPQKEHKKEKQRKQRPTMA